MTLAEFLQMEINQHGLRGAADRLGVSYNTVDDIAKGRLKTFPKIETLMAISEASGIAPWKIIEMAGVPLGISDSVEHREERIDSLLRESDDRLERLVVLIRQADPTIADTFLSIFETLMNQKTRPTNEP